MQRPRILLVADVPNWIFARHAKMLHRFLSDEFAFTLGFRGEEFDEDRFDLIYSLEWDLLGRHQIRTPQKHVTGIRSHWSWEKENFDQFVARLTSDFHRVHVVSRRLLQIFAPRCPDVAYVSHGLDTQFFTPTAAPRAAGPLRVGWAGSTRPEKGFLDLIAPLSKLPGVEVHHAGLDGRPLSMEEMRAFYAAIDVYVCASGIAEGNNNSLMEAAAMERAIVTTDNGTVPEYLFHEENALVVERSFLAIAAAVERLRDAPEFRATLGAAARRQVVARWEWRERAEDYRIFFREALRQAGARAAEISTVASPLRLLHQDGVDRAWRWLGSLLQEERGITRRLRERGLQRIAIFGTGRTARLLIADCRREDLEVVALLDNDRARQGTNLDSAEICSPAWLHNHGADIDAVLLSIEGLHDAEVRNQLEQILDGKCPILSWKDLIY